MCYFTIMQYNKKEKDKLLNRPRNLSRVVGTLQLGYPLLLCQDSRSYP